MHSQLSLRYKGSKVKNAYIICMQMKKDVPAEHLKQSSEGSQHGFSFVFSHLKPIHELWKDLLLSRSPTDVVSQILNKKAHLAALSEIVFISPLLGQNVTMFEALSIKDIRYAWHLTIWIVFTDAAHVIDTPGPAQIWRINPPSIGRKNRSLRYAGDFPDLSAASLSFCFSISHIEISICLYYEK